MHGHARAVLVQHRLVLGEDRHAGTDGGLGQVHRRNGRGAFGAADHRLQRLGHLAAQLALEFLAGDRLGFLRASSADKDDGGGQGIGAFCKNPARALCTYRPCPINSAGYITYKFLHPKRGLAAIEVNGVIPRYGGVIIHDCWASYLSYDQCGHGLCGSHLLRELTFVIDANDSAWAANMKRLLQETCAI
ncbi:transposase, partial [Thiolapillus sp.]